LMMDTHRCIAIGRNCLPFRITWVHFRLFGSLCCSCAFVIFCVFVVLNVLYFNYWVSVQTRARRISISFK
jgi:hypothetical protein